MAAFAVKPPQNIHIRSVDNVVFIRLIVGRKPTTNNKGYNKNA